ncbi:MAG: nitrous oxide reductase accessory protein NosL [Nitrospirae bacterium]|nr:nitrous oxide reductase accessory protein NosL [Nitrospirota bacterium]NTW65082.1 nitrous oxide reductase accessory protein NosL [Nitrospirota bacterium]
MTVFALLLIALPAGAEGPAVAKPSPKDKCPVCGMFVAKYPDWLATVMFKDGTFRYFDGPKDLFKFLLDLKQYAPGKGQSDVDRFFVNDYYAVRQVDGRKAFYVIGSDVYGPMGKELIPFEKETDARGFLKDHGGRSILRYHEVTSAVLKQLD